MSSLVLAGSTVTLPEIAQVVTPNNTVSTVVIVWHAYKSLLRIS
ncbi:MAG: hypothetical protein AAFO06_19930 [Cyanobacteria bacterium J06597_16]